MKKLLSFVCFLFLGSVLLQAQQTALVFGRMTDAATGEPIDLGVVYLQGTTQGANTDEAGYFALQIPAGARTELVFRRVGYQESRTDIPALEVGARFALNVALAPTNSNMEVVIEARRLEDAGMIREDVRALQLIPSTTGNLESILPHIALGTSSGSGGELTSQYNVRGGNYDENLVYVNDFEIYRPQLIRAGQQEGLSFPNIDLIRDLSFSSGGFQARYGDKLSSVLDIRYKRPDSTRASISGSFLGGSAHIEGSLKKKKDNAQAFRYLVGARYKTTRNLLSGLDVKGEYQPDFYDIQSYLTYDFNPSWQLGVLANYNRSVYSFVPQSLSRAFGLIDFALQLRTAYEGQEVDDYSTGFGGVSLTYLPKRESNPWFVKFMASRYRSQENERFDILGYYLLGEIESNLGSSDFGEVVSLLGQGVQHTWIRNRLQADVTNVEVRGGLELQKDNPGADLTRSHFLQWSVKLQNESILDKINEWQRLDSALYSLPYDTTQLLVRKVLKTQNDLSSNRLTAFFQDTWTWRRPGRREMQLTGGFRLQYWDLNKEFFISPRAQFLYRPLSIAKDISFKLSGGMYYQPAFYREMRGLDGRVNTNLSAQKSAHVVGGLSYDFLWGKKNPTKMRLIAEAYYKPMWDLVYYDIDNVRIQYSGLNNARGYSTGLDVRLNGEFVPGAESWVNLSLLRTRESINGIQHRIRERGQADGVAVKDVPRPTDRVMTLSLFVQDYMRRNKNAKVHLNFTFGTGLPFGLPENNVVYRNTYRFDYYHRADLGFSLLLYNDAWKTRRPRHFLRFTRNTWASFEVFNLFQVANEASYTWISTIYGNQLGVPNYLTSRRLNLRLRMDF